MSADGFENGLVQSLGFRIGCRGNEKVRARIRLGLRRGDEELRHLEAFGSLLQIVMISPQEFGSGRTEQIDVVIDGFEGERVYFGSGGCIKIGLTQEECY